MKEGGEKTKMNFHTASGDDYYDDMRKKYSAGPNTSKIPPHLSDEELAEWIEDLEFQKQERERRKRDNFYPNGSIKKEKTKLKKSKKRKLKRGKKNNGYV